MRRIALAAIALTGCTQPQMPPPAGSTPAGPVALAPGDPCGAQRVGDLVGKAVTGPMADDAQKRSGARAIRLLPPGAMATMDFRPDRLNIDIDDKGVVTGLRCG